MARCLGGKNRKTNIMAKTLISDIIIPSVFENYALERTATKSAFVQSGIVELNPHFDALAAGGGKTIDMPFWQDISPNRQILSDSATLAVNTSYCFRAIFSSRAR